MKAVSHKSSVFYTHRVTVSCVGISYQGSIIEALKRSTYFDTPQ